MVQQEVGEVSVSLFAELSPDPVLFGRFDEIIMNEEHLLLSPDDPRVAVVKRVCDRLVQTLNDDSPLSCFSYAEQDQTREYQRRKIIPSARTEAALLWMPEVSLRFNVYVQSWYRANPELPFADLKSSEADSALGLGHLRRRLTQYQRLCAPLHRYLPLHRAALGRRGR